MTYLIAACLILAFALWYVTTPENQVRAVTELLFLGLLSPIWLTAWLLDLIGDRLRGRG